MKHLLPLFLLSLSSTALADDIRQGGNLGVGLGGGVGVSGVSAKYFLADSHALQGVVGFWGAGRDAKGIGVSADYLLEMPTLAETDPVNVAWNLGVGGAVGIADPLFIGASGIAGLEFNFNPAPVDVVLEYRPGIRVLPDIGADLVNFSGHVRYYF